MIVHNHTVPDFLYGTAWKEERTEALTWQALTEGFRGIDTANQRKHYVEDAVGRAVSRALGEGLVSRDELFLQTKFTYQRGQDHRLPYDPEASLTEQVQQSFASSLEHLQVKTLDSYILHGPARGDGWSDADREVWAAMEALHDAGQVRLLGVSNMSFAHLETLCTEARVAPAFLQNRCYARTRWDASLRALCRTHGVVYQGFSLLTANAQELRHPAFSEMVQRTGLTPAQVVFAAALQMGMLPLTGTSDPEHMREDLAVLQLAPLASSDLETLENIAAT